MTHAEPSNRMQESPPAAVVGTPVSSEGSAPEVRVPDPLVSFDNRGLLNIACPRVLGQDVLDAMRLRAISVSDREAVLVEQNDLWADDELLFWMQMTADETSDEQNVVAVDPLMFTSMASLGDFSGLSNQFDGFCPRTKVITVIQSDGHWIPLAWRLEHDHAQGYTGRIHGAPPSCIQAAHDFVTSARAGIADPMVFHNTLWTDSVVCGPWH